jgi:putative acetyltransferase
MVLIRSELPTDIPAIGEVNREAFGQLDEAALVDELRTADALSISLVAELNSKVIGHIAFSPLSLERQLEGELALGLGPMAVLPGFQNQGIGLKLLEAGLDACRQEGAQIVIVLGHPWFYPKAGFEPASKNEILCEYDVPDEAFMVFEIVPGALQNYAGVARYHPAFGGKET